jgi:hypothetical protein
MPRRPPQPRPVSVTTTLTVEETARLQARAKLQGISLAEALRQLIATLPAPSPARDGPDAATPRAKRC